MDTMILKASLITRIRCMFLPNDALEKEVNEFPKKMASLITNELDDEKVIVKGVRNIVNTAYILGWISANKSETFDETERRFNDACDFFAKWWSNRNF